MSNEPNQKTVHDFARRAILSAVEDVDYIGIGEQFGEDENWPQGDSLAYDAMHDAVYDAVGAATVTVSWPDEQPQDAKPRVVCLCGSSRFRAEHDAANRDLTMAGHIVLGLGTFSHSDGTVLSDAEKAALDKLHLAKIDLADEVVVVSPGGYIGASTAGEIAYAEKIGKAVRYLNDSVTAPASAQDERDGDGDVRAVAEAVDRLKRWLVGRQANVNPEISTTLVRAEPYDRSSASYTIVESDVRAVVAALDARDAKAGDER